MDVEKVIREYMAQVIHLSLGTSRDNTPWVCEVHFAYDEVLNLYFRSKADRRHSEDIALNPHVAGNIVSQHELSEKPRGVYFEGVAEKLQDVDESHPAYKALAERFDRDVKILEEAKTEEGYKFYKIAVENFYLFDSRESSPSQKYQLPWPAKTSV